MLHVDTRNQKALATTPSEHHLLYLIQAHDIRSSVIELGRPRALMRCHLLGFLEIPFVSQNDRLLRRWGLPATPTGSASTRCLINTSHTARCGCPTAICKCSKQLHPAFVKLVLPDRPVLPVSREQVEVGWPMGVATRCDFRRGPTRADALSEERRPLPEILVQEALR